MWVVHLPQRVERELSELPAALRHRVQESLRRLQHEPRPPGCKKLKGRLACWRIRVGAYRMLYDIDTLQHLIIILKIGPRKAVYRYLQ